MSRTPLVEAATRNDRQLLERVLSGDLGPPQQTDLDEALLGAACHGNADCVSRLLTEGADVDCEDFDGDTPLMLSAANNHREVISVLLERGCDVDLTSGRGRTALHMAVWAGHVSVVLRLLSAGCSTDVPEQYDDTALMLAARSGFVDITAALLRAGCDVTARNDELDTALHYAARHGHAQCVRMLLDRDVSGDLDPINMWRRTPLLCAATHGRDAAAVMLVEAGADVTVVDSSGRSALHHAAIHSLPRCLRLLLARGVCPDVADADGNTPLVLAVVHNRVDAVAMLLRYGCHVDIVGHCTVGDQYVWRSPLVVAIELGHYPIAAMLVQAGSNVNDLNGVLFPERTEHAQTRKWLKCIVGVPRALTDICRIVVRRTLGYDTTGRVSHLPLPHSLREFLAFGDATLG